VAVIIMETLLLPQFSVIGRICPICCQPIKAGESVHLDASQNPEGLATHEDCELKLARYNERREDRADRFRDLADKHRGESDQYYQQARRMSEVIPMGQPILVGHYSEKGDRAYRARIDGKYDHAMEHLKTAEYYDQRASSAESNRAIMTDDPSAPAKLRVKLEKLEKLQALMVAANKVVRAKKPREDQIKALVSLGLTETQAHKLFVPDFAGRVGFPAYELQNNNAEIRRLKERIEKLDARHDDQTSEQTIGDIRIIDNVEDNRLQVFFPGIPSEQIRSRLKSMGFRWSPYNKCWQSYRGDRYMMSLKAILTS
jgi:hypothetical protein